tara:strand:- start:185 stop:1246 length:1062 start_codon:yes stop_codon:yes gene_type:complete
MGYKFQIGAMSMKGAYTQEGAMDADGYELTASSFSASANIAIGGTISAIGRLRCPIGGKFGVNDGSTNKRVRADTTSNHGRIRLYSGTDTVRAVLGGTEAGKIDLGGTVIFDTDSQVSSSAGWTVSSNIDVAGDLVVNGDVSVQTAVFESATVSTTDMIFVLGDNKTSDSALGGAGLIFGRQDADGAMFRFTEANNNPDGAAMTATDASSPTAKINISGGVFYGEGKNVTGIPGATGLANGRAVAVTKASGSTLVPGLNKCGGGGDSGASNNVWRLNLPNLGNGTTVSAGDTIRVKCTSSNISSTQTVAIWAGDSDSHIDGAQQEITLESPYAAVEFVCVNVSGATRGNWIIL